VISNSRLPAGQVIKVDNGRAEIENRIKEGKKTLRCDKTSCQNLRSQPGQAADGGSGLQPLVYDPAVLCLG
jgi:hypothetical protein